MSSFAAAPALRAIPLDVTSVSPVDRNVSAYDPTLPLRPRFVNVATPDAFVLADAVPINVAPIPVISAVMVTPDWLTGLFVALSNRTAG